MHPLPPSSQKRNVAAQVFMTIGGVLLLLIPIAITIIGIWAWSRPFDPLSEYIWDFYIAIVCGFPFFIVGLIFFIVGVIIKNRRGKA